MIATRKRAWLSGILALVALMAAAAIVAFATRGTENPHVTKGKELLAIDEVAAATREFKLALQDRPGDKTAKALLLYGALEGEEDLGTVSDMLQLYPAIRLLDNEIWNEHADGQTHEDLREAVKTLRADLYEAGIDTANSEELASVLARLARYVFNNPEDDVASDHAAFVLAHRGEHEAILRLVERLKSGSAEHVPHLLERIGREVADPLRALVRNPESLGRERAVDVLSRVLVRDAAHRMFEAYPELRGMTWSDLPSELQLDSARPFFASSYVARLSRTFAAEGLWAGANSDAGETLHARHVPIGDSDRAILLLQGVNGDSGGILGRLFIFAGSEYDEPKLLVGDTVLSEVEGPIARIRASQSGRVELAQLALVDVEVEQEVASEEFRKGDRVALKSVSSPGVVKGTDDYGLFEVRLDRPTDGMRDVSVGASMLKKIETVTRKEPRYRLRFGSLQGSETIQFDREWVVVDELPPRDSPVGDPQ